VVRGAAASRSYVFGGDERYIEWEAAIRAAAETVRGREPGTAGRDQAGFDPGGANLLYLPGKVEEATCGKGTE